MCNERNIFKDLLRCLLILYTDMSQVKAKEYQKVMHLWAHSDWDPLNDREQGTLTHTASTRIKRDLMSLFCEPPPGLFVVGDETNMKFVHAIIIGVMDTPYEGGFFYFVLKCPNDYPIHPPRVKLMTTDAGRVRFNPNMYKNGKICLSILGTWAGPAWSPAQQLSSLLVSIQSLMTEKPYFNEPGFTREQTPGDAQLYSDLIKHETLRVAVCGMLENECQLNIPNQLRGIMEKSFLEFYDQYIDTVTSNLHMDGQMMIDPFTRMKYRCQYKTTLQRLHSLHDKLTGKNTTIIRPHVQPSVNNVPTIDNTVIDEDDSPSDLQDKNEEE